MKKRCGLCKRVRPLSEYAAVTARTCKGCRAKKLAADRAVETR